MQSISIIGNISLEQVQEALFKSFPNYQITISDHIDVHKLFSCSSPDIGDNSIIIASSNSVTNTLEKNEVNISELTSMLQSKTNELSVMETTASKALASIQQFHIQQSQLYDEFVILRQKYDDQKESLLKILWHECGRYHPDLRHIPEVEDSKLFIEEDHHLGDYAIGAILGEGQYATVRLCHKFDHPHDLYALKMIKKERIATFNALKRVSNEIDILRKLDSPYVVSVKHVMHTDSMLYIVTEKGGKDLFEFFDEHIDGVPEPWARQIIARVLKAVAYCHHQGVCHRDLKPENILLSFDGNTNHCIDLKLCDFGLSARFNRDAKLTDFCGSPGFFAPEMIIKGSYYGDKADIWSIGCILLELVLGHEKFCQLWMGAYDYEVLQDKVNFTTQIQHTVSALPTVLQFSSELNDFILLFLSMRASHRPKCNTACRHIWLASVFDNNENGIGISPTNSFYDDDIYDSNSPINTNKYGSNSEDYDNISTSPHPLSTLKNLEIDDRARHMFEDDSHNHIHLPPIEPQTPSVSNIRKMLHLSTNPNSPDSDSSSKHHQNSNNINNISNASSPLFKQSRNNVTAQSSLLTTFTEVEYDNDTVSEDNYKSKSSQ